MFGISWAEFLVIILVAIIVVPTKYWPDVAKFLARVVRFIRNLVWRITDASEKIKEKIDLEKPIDELVSVTTDDMLADFSSVVKKQKKTRRRK